VLSFVPLCTARAKTFDHIACKLVCLCSNLGLSEHNQILVQGVQAPAWEVPSNRRARAVMQKTAAAAAAATTTEVAVQRGLLAAFVHAYLKLPSRE